MEKLIIVTDAWAPQVNGVATVLGALVPRLESENLSVTVIHPGSFRWVFSLPLYPEIKMVLFPGSRIREMFKTEQPDYIHIATEGLLGLQARRVCVAQRRSFTTSYHTHFPLYAQRYFFGGRALGFFAVRYLRWFHSASRATLVSTDSLKKQLESEGYTPVVVAPFGVDSNRFTRDETRAPALNLPHPVFVYFGRLAKEKSVEEFLNTPLPGSKLVIGDGPQRTSLERTYGKDATFVGYRRGQELTDYLSLADVCVFPSRTETFGLVVLEALACGIPVAAHDVMGPRDILTPGVDGELDEDLASAAVRCLSLSRDACRKTAEKYSWENATKQFLIHIKTHVY